MSICCLHPHTARPAPRGCSGTSRSGDQPDANARRRAYRRAVQLRQAEIRLNILTPIWLRQRARVARPESTRAAEAQPVAAILELLSFRPAAKPVVLAAPESEFRRLREWGR